MSKNNNNNYILLRLAYHNSFDTWEALVDKAKSEEFEFQYPMYLRMYSEVTDIALNAIKDAGLVLEFADGDNKLIIKTKEQEIVVEETNESSNEDQIEYINAES